MKPFFCCSSKAKYSPRTQFICSLEPQTLQHGRRTCSVAGSPSSCWHWRCCRSPLPAWTSCPCGQSAAPRGVCDLDPGSLRCLTECRSLRDDTYRKSIWNKQLAQSGWTHIEVEYMQHEHTNHTGIIYRVRCLLIILEAVFIYMWRGEYKEEEGEQTKETTTTRTKQRDPVARRSSTIQAQYPWTVGWQSSWIVCVDACCLDSRRCCCCLAVVGSDWHCSWRCLHRSASVPASHW